MRTSTSVAVSIGSPLRRAGAIIRGVTATPATWRAGATGVDAGVRAMIFVPFPPAYAGGPLVPLPHRPCAGQAGGHPGTACRLALPAGRSRRGRRGLRRGRLVKLQEDVLQRSFFGGEATHVVSRQSPHQGLDAPT